MLTVRSGSRFQKHRVTANVSTDKSGEVRLRRPTTQPAAARTRQSSATRSVANHCGPNPRPATQNTGRSAAKANPAMTTHPAKIARARATGILA
jgi:hypothetical protein